MPKFLQAPILGLTAAFAFTLTFVVTPYARAQKETQHPDTVTPVWTESQLVAFTGTSGACVGNNPEYGPVVQASDGNFYGTTYNGGTKSDGAIFKVTSAGVCTALHSFAGGNSDGANPYAALMQGTDGNFYGTTTYGGSASSYGVVYKMTPAGTVTILHAFAKSDGDNPYAGVVQGTDGNLYGTTYAGGANYGVVYKISTAGTGFTVLHTFSTSSADCEDPGWQDLTQGTDGYFYGVCYQGGASGNGAVYKINSTGSVFTLIHSFTGPTDGGNPLSGVYQATDGNFYGTTMAAGTQGDGTLYAVNSTGTIFTTLHAFAGGTTDGDYAPAQPMQGSDGNIYGATAGGGAHGAGVTYQSSLSPGSTYNIVNSFNTGNSGGGYNVSAGFVQGMDGNLYDVANVGGTDGVGNVFKLAPPTTFAAPVQLTVPAKVYAGASFTLSYLVTNASSETMQQCFATNTAGDTTGWVGVQTATTTSTNATLTASSMIGSYSYTLTCGGRETSIATVVVSADDSTSTAVSANPSTIGATGSTSVTVTVTDPTTPGNTPEGSVTFKFGGTTLGSCTLSSGSCSTTVSGSSLANGSNTISATYSPSGGWLASSGSTTVTVTSNVLTFTAVTHNFGTLPVGTAATSFGISVKNTSPTLAYPYSLVFTPANGFTTATNCPASIAAGATCELVFYFTPTATGTVTANWSLTPESGFAYTASDGGTLTGAGTAVGNVTLTTNGHNFGTQAVGTTSAAYGTELSNSTSSTETVTLGPVPSGPFTLLTNCGTTLAAGASCEIEFTFTPTTTSTVSVVVPLSGTPTAITAGGAALPSGGITLSGN